MSTATQSFDLVAYFSALATLELIAVVASLLYVLLAAKGSVLCWLAAIVSTILYTIIFYDVYLWMDSLLQVYYLLMALYGWLCWSKYKDSASLDAKPLAYSYWTIRQHTLCICILALLSIALGWLMANYTPTDFPYLDSATTLFAVFATYLLTQKVVENWLYFVVIDLVSIYLYIEKGLLPTAALFCCYVVLALYGYFQWRTLYRLQFRQQHNDLYLNSTNSNVLR
ncbi:nicotinamide mononucleotide transporter [Colwellia chukchiensis]|uniref:Nicotinamide riboside transporter PnuC n=1 Tax=Colwellia chukchiensis TaxID=641665 RepID=A0A1H7MJK6_9GAMM|nr:nicotinamide riboside transporter PnuC [Colwellia chukchiensis]SEL11259.1 nicotinamide mononucleotide transporter [Colwellia chukchiensis]